MRRFLYLLPVFIHRLTGWLPFQPKPGAIQFANTIPLAKCAQIVGVEPDAKFQRIADEIHAFARILVESYCETQKQSRQPGEGFSEALTLIPSAEQYALEERAAILEFDGGLDRDVAERTAITLHQPDGKVIKNRRGQR
jgi:hypothetical protein